MESHHYFNRYTSWNWMLEARTKYLQKFKVFNTEHMDLNREIFIGVYGPTQVGKTTFVLTLLGIKTDKILPLSDALRGKQKYGKSATITATVFKKSRDNYFYIFKYNQDNKKERIRLESLEELENELKKLREEITNGFLKTLEQVIIYISRTYFYNEAIDNQELSIVDLPGDDTKDDSEESHIESILEKYINLCKNIIIMELSGNITALSQIGIESMEGWYKNPFKFSVVVTRAISDASVNKLVTRRKISSADELSSHYKNELVRILYDNNGERIKTSLDHEDRFSDISVYPLELGVSLSSLKDDMDSHQYEDIITWNKVTLENLRRHLKETDTPEFQVKSLFSITNLIIEARENDYKKLALEDKRLSDDIEQLNEKMIELNRSIGVSTLDESYGLVSNIKNLKNLSEVAKSLIKQRIFKSDVTFIKAPETDSRAKQWLLEFVDLDDSLKHVKGQKYSLVNEKYNIYLRELQSVVSRGIKKLEKNFNNNLGIIKRFHFVESLKILEKQTKYKMINVKKSILGKKIKDCDNIIENEIENVKEELVLAIEKDLQKLVSFINKHIKIFENLLSELRIELSQTTHQIIKYEKDLEDLRKKERKAESRWETEFNLGDTLELFFINEYESEMKKLKSKFGNVSTLDEKILILTEMNIITFQIERLVRYGTERKNRK